MDPEIGFPAVPETGLTAFRFDRTYFSAWLLRVTLVF